jgi:class 3 adenylate cyclase
MAALAVISLAAKQVTDQKVLEEAIATLQKYRGVLDDAVVETAVSALQDQLSHSLKNGEITQYKTVTVLEADLSGFTAMSAVMDAERVRDAMNALWERLDNVVITWGGRIEQHIGDGLIALFGIPHAHEDDPQRAVLAALDMQMELALFNEAAAASDTNPLSTLAQELQMRVGIHLGPLLLGRMGQSVGVTAVGDAMRIVSEVEKKAPVGGILLSYPVYRKIFGLFEVKKMPPLTISGLDDEIPVYRVLGEKSRAFYAYNTSFSLGVQSSFMGRSEELARLELAFQETLDYSVMQVVTIAGEAGSGKSRLFAEFERWLTMLPVRGCVLRGASTSLMGSVPYGLLRTMLFDYFEIHQRSTMTVMREKFVRGVAHVSYSANATARRQGQSMGRLLGLDFTGGEYPEMQEDEPGQLEQQGIRDFVHLFTDLASRCLPLVLVLEDAQKADAASLHVIDRLLAKSPDLPILVVCLTRPSLLEKRPSWSSLDPLSPYTTIHLPPLSAIDCRHMVSEILSEVRHVPLRLSDLIVDAAGGNPLFVGQLIHLLYDEAVIQQQGERPVVHLGRLDKLMMPQTLPDLYRRRFACLDEREQSVLAAAAVIGRTFWDVAVLNLLETAAPLSRADLKAALTSLEQKELVVRQRFSTLVGPVEYKFIQEALRDEVYAQIPTAVCVQYHQQMAAWLQNRPQDRHLPFYGRMIAGHYREAGDETAAARWEER